MKPYIPFFNTVKVEVLANFDEQICENVYHIGQQNAWTGTQLQALCSQIADWYNNYIRPYQSEAVTVYKVRATDLTDQFSAGYELAVDFHGGLTILADRPLPNNCAVVIKWITGNRGRSFRGRTYHFGLTENQVNGNRLTAGIQTTLADGYGHLLSQRGSYGQVLVVASRVTNGVDRAEGLSTPIMGMVLDPVVDSQRRRLPGRGR